MKKTLLKTLLLTCLLSIWGGNAYASVVFDFTNAYEEWGIPTGTGSTSNPHDETTYSNGTYTISIAAPSTSGNGFYYNTGGYLMLCYNGSYVKLPAFDFAVGTIVFGGHSNASSSVTMNIFVNVDGTDTAVSTECTGSAEDHTFEIATDYQTAGNQYIFMNTGNNANIQLTSITVYAVGEEVGSDQPSGHGYEPDDPYTVSELIPVIEALGSGGTISGIYVKGIVSQIDEISTSYGNMTYWISDDGTTTNQLEIYRGKSLNNAGPTTESDISVGDEVVVCGTFVYYNGTTPEGQTGNTYIYSLNGSTEAPDSGGGGGDGGIDGTVTHGTSMITLTNPDVSVGTSTATFDVNSITDLESGTSVAGIEFELSDGGTVVFAKGSGGNNDPAYYTTSGNIEIRVYYNNTITFTCKQKIAKIEITTETTSYEGSDVETVVFSEDGTSAEFCNVRDGSNNTQLRVEYITVYYEGEGGDDTGGTTIGGLETFENGSFEEWEESYPVGWHSTTSASNHTITKSEVYYDGQYSAQIPHSSSSNNRLASKEFLLPAGTYNISFYAKPATNDVFPIIEFGYAPWDAEKDAMGTYQYITVDGSNQITLSSNDWTEYTGSFTLTDETQVNLVIMCHQNGAGDVLIDLYSIEQATGTITISSAGYATYYTDVEYTMPEGVTGTTVTGVEEEQTDGGYLLDMDWSYTAGSTVPAGTALVLKGSEGTYTYTITSTNATAPTDNLLLGSTSETTTTEPNKETTGYVFYELTNGENGIGFYWGAANGVAFTSGANKAWLALTTEQSRNARFLGFGDGDDTTGISSVESASEGATVKGIYTIQGVRVSNMNQPGLYIVDGRKVLVK